MFLDYCDILAVTDDLQEIVVTNKVEPCESSSLSLEIVTECFLNIGEHVDDAGEGLLKSLNVHSFNDVRLQ